MGEALNLQNLFPLLLFTMITLVAFWLIRSTIGNGGYMRTYNYS